MNTHAQETIAELRRELFERAGERDQAILQQSATAEVLKVISRSAFDLDSVMQTLATSAAQLCGASMSALYRREGNILVARGIFSHSNDQTDFLRNNPLQLSGDTFTAHAVLTGDVANIADAESEPKGNIRKFGRTLGYRAILILP